MAIQLKQSLRLGQNLVMTPQLQQAIKLLQLNHLELAELVNQELVENPVLEELGESDGDAPQDNSETAASGETADPEFERQRDEQPSPVPEEQQALSGKEEINWEQYLEDYNNTLSSAPSMREIPEEMSSQENVLTKAVTLEDHLQWQLSMIACSENEYAFAIGVISNLGDDGYFTGDLQELATQAGLNFEDATEFLKVIQTFDPVGIASRNLQECLLVQAEMLDPKQHLVESIILSHMPELEKRNLPAISRALGVSLEKVAEAHKIITDFEPKPGSAFRDTEPQYITPEIFIHKVGEEHVIAMNEDGLPRLRVSPYYRKILADQKGSTSADSKVTKEYVQEKLKSALWLIRSIQNRQKTIHKVTEAILKRQGDFFAHGVQHLKPMVLKDIAADVGMHESTISRVTTNKYMHTPVGTFELKYFFNSSIASSDGKDALASSAVKDKIKNLIGKEDPLAPLSDQQLVELLKTDGVDIARRTVAKYREMLGVLPSGKRRKLF